MNLDQKGSRVLLITPLFYDLEKKIISELEDAGCSVQWIENKNLSFDYHGTYSKFKLLRKLYFFLFSPQIHYIKKQLKQIENHHFDVIFSINAHIICPYLLNYLKKLNPGLFSVLFLWDSSSMYKWDKEISFFDKVLTFDKADSLKLNIGYKPNFYLKDAGFCNDSQIVDMVFIGKFNSRRLSLIDKILKRVEGYRITSFMKLWPSDRPLMHSRIMYIFMKKFFAGLNWTDRYIINYEALEGIIERDYIIFDCSDYQKMLQVSRCANVIIDIPFPGQTGHTHRFIDAMVHGQKVITTDENIRNEFFFNQEQVLIIDIENPVIDIEWIKSRTVFPVIEQFRELELKPWLASLLNDKIA